MLRAELKPIPRNWRDFRNLGVLSVIERRSFGSLSGDERTWLKAKHHFLFDDSKGAWGALMWNDDEIAPAGTCSCQYGDHRLRLARGASPLPLLSAGGGGRCSSTASRSMRAMAPLQDVHRLNHHSGQGQRVRAGRRAGTAVRATLKGRIGRGSPDGAYRRHGVRRSFNG